jgi:hypothetical protein
MRYITQTYDCGLRIAHLVIYIVAPTCLGLTVTINTPVPLPGELQQDAN